MGHLSRFVEPVLLLLLRKKGRSHGYELAESLGEYALTDAEVDRGQLYRTLKNLEENGHVVSEWDTEGRGPARRLYKLTPSGEEHLREWAEVLGRLSKAAERFVTTAGELDSR